MKIDLEVWAPTARTVAVVGDSRPRIAMEGPDDQGWFRASADLGPHARYGFSLDGGPPRPDPRSPWQPDGVHGLSRPVDHTALPWTDAGWSGRPLRTAVFYELHVGTFSPEGTFDGAAVRLDHLVDLGVDVVELMPVAQFPGQHGWGYDGVDLYAPHHAYGGPNGLKRLVDACHARGLAVVIDVVYNHLGPSGNYLADFGPYFTDRYSTPWGTAVNLDGPDSDPVRAFVVDNALMWLRDYHADGLRLDAVHAIVDTSAVHILEEVATAVEALGEELGRPLFLVAESDLNDPRIVRPRRAGGYGIDAQWSDDFHHALHAVLTGEKEGYYADFGSVGHLAKALRQGFVYDGQYSNHRRRRHGRPPAGVESTRFLGYLQNHDQVGNRATGERSSMLLSTAQLETAAALVLLGPFVPMLFQGEEWGASTPFLYFTDHDDPDLGRAVSEGRRREFAAFGWSPDEVPDPQDPETFEASVLRWDELTKEPHAALLEWHRRLIALRRSLPPVDFTDVEVRYDEDERWLILDRGPLSVVCNLSPEPRQVPSGVDGTVLLAPDDGWPASDGAAILPPGSAVVVGR